MTSIAQHHCLVAACNKTNISPHHHRRFIHGRISVTSTCPFPLKLSPSPSFQTKALNNNNGDGYGGGCGSGGGDRRDIGDDDDDDVGGINIIGLFIQGWRSRVTADPQFPFKVLMEEVVGVSANVLGDMATRPNFGLNDLHLVLSTLVVGAILNFLLMYILAPTTTGAGATASLFSTCPQSHMFQPGPYTVLDRFGTFVYKGGVFAVVGFSAGLVGTAISNGLVKMRNKMDPSPSSETPPPPTGPPTLLNALTWAAHMGVSCNLRYQSLNGIEFVLAKTLTPLAFKASVLLLRCFNNVMGGVTFVMLARLTGSQSHTSPAADPLLVTTTTTDSTF